MAQVEVLVVISSTWQAHRRARSVSIEYGCCPNRCPDVNDPHCWKPFRNSRISNFCIAALHTEITQIL